MNYHHGSPSCRKLFGCTNSKLWVQSGFCTSHVLGPPSILRVPCLACRMSSSPSLNLCCGFKGWQSVEGNSVRMHAQSGCSPGPVPSTEGREGSGAAKTIRLRILSQTAFLLSLHGCPKGAEEGANPRLCIQTLISAAQLLQAPVPLFLPLTEAGKQVREADVFPHAAGEAFSWLSWLQPSPGWSALSLSLRASRGLSLLSPWGK